MPQSTVDYHYPHANTEKVTLGDVNRLLKT